MRKVMAAAALLAACAGSAHGASAWKDLFSPPFTGAPLQVMLGMSCTSANACFIAGGTSTGFGIYKVTDPSFKSGARLLNVTGRSPLKVMLAVAMEDENHGVGGGLGLAVGGTYYTNDGENFDASLLQVGLLQTQAMYANGGGRFAYVGQYNSNQGVAVSKNGGVSFKGAWLPKDFSVAPARYGAFPTEDVMYVTGGSWPSSDNNKVSGVHELTEKLRFNSHTGKYEERTPVLGDANNTYTAMIAKSSDGGATWEKQYESTGEFYFNGISCASATVCMAVAEGFGSDGSSEPGAHVFKTEDGKTWKEVFVYGNATIPGSAMDVKMLSETEAWVGFSYAVSTFNSGAAMGHTTDGGKTWSIGATMPGVGTVTQMSFVDDNTAFAAAVTVYQISTVLAFGPQ